MIFLSYSYHLYVFYVRVVSFSFCVVPAVPPTERPGETGPRFGIVACPHACCDWNVRVRRTGHPRERHRPRCSFLAVELFGVCPAVADETVLDGPRVAPRFPATSGGTSLRVCPARPKEGNRPSKNCESNRLDYILFHAVLNFIIYNSIEIAIL